MTALLTAHGGQDWTGFAVVIGILIVLSALAYADVWRADRRTLRRNPAPEPEVDHVDCSNPDCTQTICHCRQPSECPSTTTLGCEHEDLCWDCRLGCVRCRVAQLVEWVTL